MTTMQLILKVNSPPLRYLEVKPTKEHVLTGKLPTFLSEIEDQMSDTDVYLVPCKCTSLADYDEGCEGGRVYYFKNIKTTWYWQKYSCEVDITLESFKKNQIMEMKKIEKDLRKELCYY